MWFLRWFLSFDWIFPTHQTINQRITAEYQQQMSRVQGKFCKHTWVQPYSGFDDSFMEPTGILEPSQDHIYLVIGFASYRYFSVITQNGSIGFYDICWLEEFRPI